tara:strand:+ start:1067 stop:1417 length:351 start_codon:yes stop_codon:yes gene_type:complete
MALDIDALSALLAQAEKEDVVTAPKGSVKLSSKVVSKGYWFTRLLDEEFIKVKAPADLEPEDNIFCKDDIIPTDVLDAIQVRAELIDCSIVGAPQTKKLARKGIYRYWLAPNKEDE